MIKVVAVFIAVVVIGGFLYWVLSPFLPSIGSTIPQLTGLVSSAQTQIQPIINYAKENALQVTAVTGAVGGFCTMVWSKVYKHNIQKKDLEVTAKMNEVQGQYFTLDAEKRTLENALEQAKSKITTLEDGATTVQDLTVKLESKSRELEKAITEKNQLERLIPNIQSVEQMKEELKKVP